MKRLLPLMVTLLALGALAAPVSASNHQSGTPTTKKDCEEAGGTWVNNRGEKSCIIVKQEFELEITADLPIDVPWDTDSVIDGGIVETRTQRGTIDAPGTSDTYSTTVECRVWHVDGEMVAPGDQVQPEDVCEWITRQLGD